MRPTMLILRIAALGAAGFAGLLVGAYFRAPHDAGWFVAALALNGALVALYQQTLP
jgi:hypothetical protein